MNQIINLKQFYKSKRVLITGHTGFKGSWLTLWLKHLGAEICGVSLPTRQALSLFNKADCGKDVTSCYSDIRNLRSLGRIFKSFKPQVVFHLAAQPLVRLSYEKPVETFQINIMGLVNVFEAVRHSDSVRSLVCVTSDKCYENLNLTRGYKETDRLGGKDPYSASKAASEIVIHSYYHSFLLDLGIGVASGRAGNVIGGGDWARDRIFPDAVKSLAQKRTIEVRNPDSVRPWQHVLDPLYGYLVLGAKLLHEPTKYSGPWNFAPSLSSCRSVKELVRRVIFHWGEGSWKIHRDSKAPHEAAVLKLSYRKALSHLHWKPLWDLNTAVRKTVAWYRSFYDGDNDARRLCMADILAYQEAVF